MTDAITAPLGFPEVEGWAVTKEHVVPTVNFDHRRQCLALIRTQTVGDDRPRFFLRPVDAVTGNRVANLVGAIRRFVRREPLPTNTKDIPHVELIAEDP